MQGWLQDSLAASRCSGPASPSHLQATCQRLGYLPQCSSAHRHQRRRPREHVRRAQCSSSPLIAEEEHEEDLQARARSARPPQSVRRRDGSVQVATLRATKAGTLDVDEGPRPLAEYMALPASQYSVLDAQRIERLDESTFRCYVGGLRLFSLVVEPVLTVSVVVGERGPTVKLLQTELQGSPAVEAANDRFSATMTNVVRWSDAPASAAGAQRRQLRSDTEIQVALEVPGWMRMVPLGAIERTGSGVMQRVLVSMVPRFLRQLAADYALWAAGDDSRKPIGTGQL